MRGPKSGGDELDGRQWLEYPSTVADEYAKMPQAAAGAPQHKKQEESTMGVGPWVPAAGRDRHRAGEKAGDGRAGGGCRKTVCGG